MTAEAERIADFTWRALAGDYTELRRLVEAMGGRWRDQGPDRPPIIDSCHGMTVGFPHLYDPIGMVSAIGYALYGPLWTSVPATQQGFDLVVKQWSERGKAAKAAAKKGKR